jgi:signal transduction histidine kinase
MDNQPVGWKTIAARPIFRFFLVMLAGILGVFIISIPFLPWELLLVEAILLLLSATLSFVGLYDAARVDWQATVDRSELKSILGSIEDAIIVYDENFTVVFFNAAAEKIFKLNASATIGHRLTPRDVENDGWRTLIQVVFPSLAPQVIARSPEGQYPVVADVSFADPELEIRVATAPVVDEKGRTIAFIKIIRDRTPQIAALRAKDDFITVASHQLRGPVADISWALESLMGATDLSPADRSIVENATAASKGLLRRIEDLLNVSRMEEGHFGYQFEETDINEFVAKTLADLLPAARKAGIKLYFDRPSEILPRIMIDPRRLSIVLVNLIENAMRYNIENGEVIVRVEKLEGKPFLEITVKDTGIGIPPEALPKLFTKFFRAENAVKLQTEGSGIGLYIARNIVRAHGGEIWAESELGRGTSVHFTLPTDASLVPKHEVATETF